MFNLLTESVVVDGQYGCADATFVAEVRFMKWSVDKLLVGRRCDRKETDTSNMADEFKEKFEKLSDTVNQLPKTPYPAWVFSGLLLYKGITTHKPIGDYTGTSGGSYKFSQSLSLSKPSRVTCFTFGAAHLLGGWILYDGDIPNGAGFNFAWSTLYLLVNGKSSVKSLVQGRLNPVGLSILAIGNVGLYGKEFFWH